MSLNMTNQIKTNVRSNPLTLSLMVLATGFLSGLGGCRLDIPEGQTPGSMILGQLLGQTNESKYTKLIEQLNSPDADVRRETVLALSKGRASKVKSTPELLAVVALDDQDSLVKATAVETLGHFSDWPLLVDLLEKTARDESKQVRLATVNVLRSIEPDEKKQTILLSLLAEDLDSEVQGETAEVLGAYPDRRVLRGLIHAVAADDFRVSYLSRKSLVQLTGQDYQYDNDAWRTWLTQTEHPFENSTLTN